MSKQKVLDICENSDMLQSKVISSDIITYTFTSSDFYKLKQLESDNEIFNFKRFKTLTNEICVLIHNNFNIRRSLFSMQF